ncbi:MAG TPA: hypothetical protein VHF89_01655 [Solirubrobacteraceae bacterium]|nr:hypothetical protein [Solirubrobacteraceae bacterium]
MSRGDDNGGGLSLQTLVIASLSSLAAALFIHEFWQGGAILGAAVTPVIVAIVSELLRKPADAFKGRTTTVNPPPVVQPREDRYGIWEEQRRRPLHLKLALATGAVAFLIAAFFLTGAELVIGGADDSDRFRVLPGKQEQKDSRDRDRDSDAPARTAPDDSAPAPETTPEETTPEETTPEEVPPPEETTPEEEAPPEETVPTPEPPATTPVP